MNLENNKPVSVIVSPFFPFNRIFSNEVVYSLFGSIQYNPIFLDYSKDTTYDEFVLNISQIIINEKEPVYIVSFGVFSYIAGDPFFYSDICTFSTYIGGTAGKVVRSSQKLAAAGSCPGWFYNIYRNRTSAVGKNSFWTRRQHIFNICGSSLLGDIYVCTIWFYVMAR